MEGLGNKGRCTQDAPYLPMAEQCMSKNVLCAERKPKGLTMCASGHCPCLPISPISAMQGPSVPSLSSLQNLLPGGYLEKVPYWSAKDAQP